MSTRASLIAATLEAAFNRALKYDPGSRAQLAKLAGRVIALDCTEPACKLFFVVDGDTLRVQAHCETTSDCTVRGRATEFAKLALSGQHSLADSGVYIEGNPGVMQQVQNLVQGLEIDWEDALGEVIGSLPAHALAESLRAKARWAKPRAEALPGYLSDLVTSELNLLPSANEAEALYDDIDQLRARAARLSARIDLIKQRITA